jgi:drug/metabolite transporter (DMT)-like permease
VSDRSHTTPTPLERWLEDRFPPYRFGIVLVLLVATYVFLASGFDGSGARFFDVVLQGLTLLAALLASRTGRHLFRVAVVVVALALVSAIGIVIVPNGKPGDSLFLLSLLLVAAAPVAIGRALWQRMIVDIKTVLGAICIYLLLGMFFAFLFAFVGAVSEQPFFAQTAHASVAEYLYFSFITLCTVGYGDFTAAQSLGRSMASGEALIGQLYLVTIVAVVVSRMARNERPRRAGDADEAGDA